MTTTTPTRHRPTPPHEIHRIVTCLEGQVTMGCEFQPRHDYARAAPEFRPLQGNSESCAAVQARGGGQTVNLLSSVPLTIAGGKHLETSPCKTGKAPPSCWHTGTTV